MASGLGPASVGASTSPDLAAVAGAAWALASLGVLAASAAFVRRRMAGWRAERVDGVAVRVAPAAGPMVVGWLRPVVVLPEWALAAPPAERALILAHETEHVAARDPLLLVLAGVLMVLTPWNPFVWPQRRWLRARVETDCDARVLARGVDRRGYGELLLRTAAAPRWWRPATSPLADVRRRPTSRRSRSTRRLSRRAPRRPWSRWTARWSPRRSRPGSHPARSPVSR